MINSFVASRAFFRSLFVLVGVTGFEPVASAVLPELRLPILFAGAD
jgi:hypothetical protein